MCTREPAFPASSRPWRSQLRQRTLLFAPASTPSSATYHLGDRAGKSAAAAGIAELIGGTDIAEVVYDAKRRFCGIRLSQLSEAEIRDNKPNPGLYERTTELAAWRWDTRMPL